MKTPNLNPGWRVFLRVANQWARRQFFRFDTPLRRRLWREKMDIAMHETLTTEQRAELGRLNWILGNGSVFRLTPLQEAEQLALARQIIAKLAAERGWKEGQ